MNIYKLTSVQVITHEICAKSKAEALRKFNYNFVPYDSDEDIEQDDSLELGYLSPRFGDTETIEYAHLLSDIVKLED